MTYRITDPDYVTLTVTVGVRATVSVTVQLQVPRADADDLDLDADDAVGSLDAEITDTSEADADTFSDLDNIESLNQAAAEALAEYRATLGGSMTLTNALRLALATPSDLEPLRALTPGGHVANAIACALAPPVDDDRGQRALRAVMALDAGAAVEDVRAVVHDADPRSAEWVSAAERLAAWADGVAP